MYAGISTASQKRPQHTNTKRRDTPSPELEKASSKNGPYQFKNSKVHPVSTSPTFDPHPSNNSYSPRDIWHRFYSSIRKWLNLRKEVEVRYGK